MTVRDLRKPALTAHVAASVGWLGAVLAYLALALRGVSTQDVQDLRSAYTAMAWTVELVIVPLALASLLTGLVSSFVCPWGLVRHYWVLIKLVINVVTTLVLLLYTRSIEATAELAGGAVLSEAVIRQLRSPTHVVHAGAALLLLLLAAVLAIYKPRGLTPYGQRRQEERRNRTIRATAAAPPTAAR